MSTYVESLVGKWDEILSEGQEINNRKVKRATAVMLENQINYLTGKAPQMNESSSVDGTIAPDSGNDLYGGTGSYNTNAEFHKIAIPMVRRTFPELIAHDIVGVQPMTGPVGLAFALRFRADQSYAGQANTEIGYNTIDPYYTGDNTTSRAMGTVAAEELGSNTAASTSADGFLQQGQTGEGVGDRGLGIGSGKQIKELSMTVEKAQVEAGTRKLRSRWSLEVAQDLKAMHGLDLEEEMMDVLAYEITAEIDRELINVMRSVAANNASSTTWDYAAADGRWEAEKYRNFYNLLVRKANRIAVDTRRGAGNFVIAAPSICASLETTSSFTIQPVAADVNSAVTGIAKIGSLDGRMTVYRDTFATIDDIIIGYKGPSEYDTGIIYLPYIQLLVSKAVFEDSFNPTVGLMSRYAIHQHIFGAENYYIQVAAQNLP
ncbi:MAG: Major capsid protein Gp23 [Candidatus Izimaplasma bacterium HR2]|nr:MAG: Major capsid protein Gp23 [Candidatus Izimaplasma bacterium HR2]